MHLMVIIIKKEEKLDDLLHLFKEQNIKNITVLNSTSEVEGPHFKNKEPKIFGSFRYLKDYYNDESRVILHIGEEKEIEIIKTIVKQIVHQDEYVFFTVPISNIEGSIL